MTLWSLATIGKLLFAGCVVGLTALGVWIASSIAAYHNGPIWLTLLVGLLAFPLGPLLWDLVATRRKPSRPRILTLFDRLVLRTLAINMLLFGLLFTMWPRVMFTALSARGDWMLDGRGAWAEPVRGGLFVVADRLEWLHVWLHDNPYEDLLDDDEADDVTPEPVSDDIIDELQRHIEDTPDTTEADQPPDPFQDDGWPWRPELHPAVVDLPPQAETSIASVAQYLVEAEPDPLRRLKAAHDYVADRVAYDVKSFRAGEYPPQDAETVFRTHLSVCAGYANLLEALGDEAGLEVVVVSGDARGLDGSLSGLGHAWNAARVDGRWYLLDATWDAGHVDDEGFTKEYETTYLMSPPTVFGVTHFPDDDKWQLRAEPISRGDFLRQPLLRGGFYAHGLQLRTPDRSQTTVDGPLAVEIDNPGGYELGVYARPRGQQGPMTDRCAVDRPGRWSCDFAGPGAYEVGIFGPTGFFGNLQVNVNG